MYFKSNFIFFIRIKNVDLELNLVSNIFPYLHEKVAFYICLFYPDFR
jgi:hypothetical protein